MKIYIIKEINKGWDFDISYHQTKDGALNKLKEISKNRMNEIKSSGDLAKKDDMPDGFNHRNGTIREVSDLEYKNGKQFEFDKKNVKYVCDIFYWYKTSYEYDEYDVECVEFRVIEIEVEN